VQKDYDTMKITFTDPTGVWSLRPSEAKSSPYPKFWIVRDPWDRFKSLWRQKCRDKGEFGNEEHNEALYSQPPKYLMEYIASGHRNWHWLPQIELMGDVKAHLVPLEKMAVWWREQGADRDMVHEHISQGHGEEWDYELKERVLDYYKEDSELYEESLLQWSERPRAREVS
jgi:hypothetical protein